MEARRGPASKNQLISAGYNDHMHVALLAGGLHRTLIKKKIEGVTFLTDIDK